MVSVHDITSSPIAQSRILVCDDAATVRQLMAGLLGRSHQLLLTSTAEEALERAPEFAPDLVVTDLVLPGMSGRDLIARLRAIPAFQDVPMVLVTAVGDADARADGLEAGADDYLVKPIRERELLARVASLLRLRRTVLALSQRTRALEEANEALHAAQEQLARSERLAATGALAAALAHDLNNPLSLVASGASALRSLSAEVRGRPETFAGDRLVALMEELGAVAEEVADGSRRLQEIGQDLRLFGAAAPSVPGRVRADDAVQTAAEVARSRFGALPRIEVAVAEPLELAAPSHLVTLALLSILDRAVLAAGAAGAVRVDVRRVGAEGEIAVRDDGPAIPDTLLARIFEPFARARATGETAGLGLSVAAGIVQGLGGHIGVDPGLARGACFRVRLPLARP